jgi:hypothetical protein
MPDIRLASISWIDDKSVPEVGFWIVVGALVSWPRRVIMGLTGTANPEPPVNIPNTTRFAGEKQYRALLAVTLTPTSPRKITDVVIDPGYTPPFDKSKIHTTLRKVAPIPDDSRFYAGERSALSDVCLGRIHQCSSLKIPRDSEVVLSALIKFRAGSHTDNIGIQKAKSPVHVPWVWCEYALISARSTYRLLCVGSTFPSHAWYVNGRQVGKRLQKPIAISEKDPALSTGQPAKEPQAPAEVDKSSGPCGKQLHSLAAGEPLDIPLPNL